MKPMTKSVEKANMYIGANTGNINSKYRHKFHLMAPIGWINDPNGFCVFRNEYHLFYQYYHYAAVWGPMHWGHAKSDDMIRWQDLPVALGPGAGYDETGIFSGSAYAVGDELRLYYTGHRDPNLLSEQEADAAEPETEVRQVQCLASSCDGLIFEKHGTNPIIGTEQIPDNIKPSDFRDPKVWKHEGNWYMAVGAKTRNDMGEVLFYKSRDGIEWSYLNNFVLEPQFGTVFECPDLFQIGDKCVLFFSPQQMMNKGNNFENVHSALALIGNFDYGTGRFEMETFQEIDQGFDFYAPQTVSAMNGERVMIAWMNMWERSYVLNEENHGWNGSMTLPRKITVKDSRLYQWPIDAFDGYRGDKISFAELVVEGEYRNEMLSGKVMDLEMFFDMEKADDFEIAFFSGTDEEMVLQFEKFRNEVHLSRLKTKRPIISLNEPNDFIRSCTVDCSKPIHIRAVLDESSVEIFLNHGETAMSALFFPEKGSDGIVLRTSGKVTVNEVNKWNINI